MQGQKSGNRGKLRGNTYKDRLPLWLYNIFFKKRQFYLEKNVDNLKI